MSELTINPVATLAATLVERTVNTALSMDPIASTSLAELHGRKIGIDVSEPAMSFEITVADDTLRVLARSADQPHVRIRGRAGDLVTAATNRSSAGLQIDGDEGLALQLGSIFAQLEPDIATPLSSVLGERNADTLVGVGETAFSLISGVFRQLGNSASQSLSKPFAGRGEAEQLIAGIETLRERVDRLQARLDERASRETNAPPNA